MNTDLTLQGKFVRDPRVSLELMFTHFADIPVNPKRLRTGEVAGMDVTS